MPKPCKNTGYKERTRVSMPNGARGAQGANGRNARQGPASTLSHACHGRASTCAARTPELCQLAAALQLTESSPILPGYCRLQWPEPQEAGARALAGPGAYPYIPGGAAADGRPPPPASASGSPSQLRASFWRKTERLSGKKGTLRRTPAAQAWPPESPRCPVPSTLWRGQTVTSILAERWPCSPSMGVTAARKAAAETQTGVRCFSLPTR
mmetsp:Transcript_40347/g.124690  ORF Transcript_40347/g.124690 Transcript_40347/m.124690 type:complete len:211 (+) Transcript_40347:63-695(+)